MCEHRQLRLSNFVIENNNLLSRKYFENASWRIERFKEKNLEVTLIVTRMRKVCMNHAWFKCLGSTFLWPASYQ